MNKSFLVVILLTTITNYLIVSFHNGRITWQYHHHHHHTLNALRKSTSTTTSSSSSSSSLSSEISKQTFRAGLEPNLDDFEHILDAIYIFKKAFGDTSIPVKFEVPDEQPWPNHLHGLKLGKRLETILSSESFFTNHSDKVKALEKMGFIPSVDSLVDEWTSIMEALKTYKELNGDMRIPLKFVVPNEDPWPPMSRKMRLGMRVSTIRTTGRYVKQFPERKALLDSWGFEWNLRDNSKDKDIFDDMFLAMITYKKLVDNSAVITIPPDFKVPSQDPSWPTSTWGLNLGNYAELLQKREKNINLNEDREMKLSEIGFVIEDNAKKAFSKKRFDIVYAALITYKEIYGDLRVPQVFIVPSESPWSEDLWELKLGARVNAIRCQGTLVTNDLSRRKLLDDLGFIWELPKSTSKNAKSKHVEADDTDESFPGVDGTDSQNTIWPTELDKATPELKKKSISTSMSLTSRTISGNTAMSFDPSQVFDTVQYREVAAEAIREYMFAREWESDAVTRETSHFEGKLTVFEINRALTRAIPDEDIEIMKTFGYRILEFGRFYWDDVVEALNCYKKLNGNVNVPFEFEINDKLISSVIGYNERLEGLRLGEIVAGLRQGDIDGLEDELRRPLLDKLGFDWGDKSKYQRYRFIPMFYGLRLFDHLYGFPLPQYDFIVPDEPQWPYWMINMPLGEWAAVARIQQNMMEEHYPHRKDMLQSLKFPFWVPPGNINHKYFSELK